MKRPRYYGWTIVVALGITTCVSYGVSQYLFGLLVDPLTREFGWSQAALNAGYSGTVLVSGLAGLYVGTLVDRFGARLLMSVGSIVGAISLLLLARVHTLLEFQLLWTVGMGLASALTYYPISFTVVANWFDQRRSQAFSLLTFLGAFSSPIFYPLGGSLIGAYGWREALVILAGIQLVICLPLHAIVVRRHPEDIGLRPDGAAEAGESTPTSGITLAAAISGTPFILITTAIALSYFSSTVVILEHVAYLIAKGWTLSLAATLVGLLGLAYLPGRALIAFAAGRVPLAVQIAIAFVVEAFGVTLLVFSRDLVSVLAYIIVFGAAYGAIAPLRGAILAERFGRRAYGAITAAQGLIIGIASAIGPIVAGRLIDTLGYAAALSMCALLFVCAAAAILILELSTKRPAV